MSIPLIIGATSTIIDYLLNILGYYHVKKVIKGLNNLLITKIVVLLYYQTGKNYETMDTCPYFTVVFYNI